MHWDDIRWGLSVAKGTERWDASQGSTAWTNDRSSASGLRGSGQVSKARTSPDRKVTIKKMAWPYERPRLFYLNNHQDLGVAWPPAQQFMHEHRRHRLPGEILWNLLMGLRWVSIPHCPVPWGISKQHWLNPLDLDWFLGFQANTERKGKPKGKEKWRV